MTITPYSLSVASGAVPVFGGYAAGAILSVTEFLNQRVFQHVGGIKSVPVAGTCSGAVKFVQARAVDWLTGTPVTGWVTIATNPVGGVFSGYLPVPTGLNWYRLQVRDGVDKSSVAGTSNKFGVGGIIALIGQSNMANFQTTAQGSYPSGSKSCVEYSDAGTFLRIGNIADGVPYNTLYPTGHQSSTHEGSNADGYTYLANQLMAGLGYVVCLIERAAPGSSMTSWVSGGGNNNWKTFADALTAIGGDCEMAYMYIGETDAGEFTTASMVAAHATVHSQLKTLTGRTAPGAFKYGVVAVGTGPYLGSPAGAFGQMRAADIQYATQTTDAFLAATNHDTATVANDHVHLTGEGHSRKGRLYAKNGLAAKGIGTATPGPYISSATRSGNVVTWNITHVGGSALQDGAGGNGTTLTGGQFFDAGAGGAQIAATASIIVGNTVQWTLASTPVGALTTSNAMMDVPHGDGTGTNNTFVAATCVYDNAIYLNSGSIGVNLQPCAAIPVT